ncbi:hypothetical protein [Methylorubrum extorquens]
MALYGPSTATASVTANTNLVTVTGMDLTIVTPGMTISLGARDRKTGDAWIIGAVTPNGANGGTLITAGSIPTGYANAPFVIDTTGYLGTDVSYAAATSLSLLQTLATLFGPATNLYSGARQIVLDKLASTALGRIAFAIAGRTWGDLVHREYAYTPTGGSQIATQVMELRAFPDGSTPIDALRVDLSAGTVDFRQNEMAMASAATVDLGSAPAGRVVITGSAAILSFGAGKNLTRLLRFTAARTLTHNATSLILPASANIVTAAGDTALATSDSAGNWRVRHYTRATGYPLISPQVVSGNCGATGIPAGVTRYFAHGIVAVAASQAYQPAGRRGRFSKLRVATPGPPGAGETWMITLQKLFSDTALTCTISGSGSNDASDLVNSVLFEASDRWSLKVVSSAGATGTNCILFSMLFEAID